MLRDIPRIVITGLGAVTPIGNTLAEYWEGLQHGRNGIGRVTLFEPEGMPVQIAGEVKDWDPEPYMDRKSARRTGRFAQFALAASMQAVEDAGLTIDASNRDDIGVVIATSGDVFNMGEQWDVLTQRGPSRVDPLIITRMGQHMGAGRVGLELGVRGPNTTINTACASGSDALGHALNLLRLGHARAILAGGAEAMVTPLSTASMGRLGALSHNNADPEHACRPFDADRDGFILGEGAGVLVLEIEELARERGARIYAELAGVGWSYDATNEAAPDAGGQALAITRALRDAGLDVSEVDYINAHGTSTPVGDIQELKAVAETFGASAPRISSTKSLSGHSLGAAGVQEAIYCLLMMEGDFIAASANIETLDEAAGSMPIVRERIDGARLSRIMSNSFGFGGTNASLVMQRFTG